MLRSNEKKWFGIMVVLVVCLATVGVARADYDQLAKLTASDAAAGDYFGESVAISGSIALVGAFYNDDAGTNSGSAYLFDFSDPCDITEIKLTASDAEAGDFFGFSVAISGSTAIVGAFGEDDPGGFSGAAYLYDFSDPCNIIETKLTASDITFGVRFGYSVGISGTTALVGALYDDEVTINAGAAYLYDFSDPCNITETKLTASDAAANDQFGFSVALSGTTALVGARYDDDAGTESGSAYFFDFSDPCNIIETKLTASDAAAGDYFGESVAISGSIALVGAFYNDDAGTNSGSAYLFDFSDPCNIIETKLTASDAAAGDWFGASMAISGATAIVGAYGNDDAGTESGSAYLYDFNNPCSITETKLTASDAAAGDWFGLSVALSSATAIVGAPFDDAAGSAYLFDVPETCLFAPVGDINLDCRVDLRDFALMAGNWLVDCILDPADPACLAP